MRRPTACRRDGGAHGEQERARSGETNRPKKQRAEQLYEEAKRKDIKGRTRMTKAELQRAVVRKK